MNYDGTEVLGLTEDFSGSISANPFSGLTNSVRCEMILDVVAQERVLMNKVNGFASHSIKPLEPQQNPFSDP
jgi:hypothetical protein